MDYGTIDAFVINFNTTADGKIDFSGTHTSESITTGSSINIFSDNIIEPAEGLNAICWPDPSINSADTTIVDGAITTIYVAGIAGSSDSFPINLQNLSTGSQVLSYQVGSSRGWVQSFSDSTAILPPFDSAQFSVDYTIPETVEMGVQDTVIAILTIDEFFSDTSYNVITCLGDSSILVPVELSLFIATQVDNYVLLQWETNTESNNYGFEIERQAKDQWQKIGFVKGHNTTTVPQSYQFTDRSIVNEGSIQYRLKQLDFDGLFKYSRPVIVHFNSIADYKLFQNYPNPFNPETTIKYQLPIQTEVRLEIYNLRGELVKTLVDKKQPLGYHTVRWKGINEHGKSVASGIYFYTLKAKDFVQSRKILLMQ